MVSAALWLARARIEPLPEEPSSAFVSMPFAEPFATRYRQFYVPLLRAQGFRALRAWGGVAFEDYWDLLVALIKKASGFLADITGNNLNVLHEVGLAEGLGKTAMLVIQGTDALAASNLGYHAAPRSTSRWPHSSFATLTGNGVRTRLDLSLPVQPMPAPPAREPAPSSPGDPIADAIKQKRLDQLRRAIRR